MSKGKDKVRSHCRRPMRFVGELHTHSKVNVGFPIDAGDYNIFSCTDRECDQVDYVPFTNEEAVRYYNEAANRAT